MPTRPGNRRPPHSAGSGRHPDGPTDTARSDDNHPRPRPHPRHLAARAAAWSVRHRRLAIGGWLLGVVLAVVVGGMVGTKQLSDIDYASGEDKRAQQALADHGFEDPATENVLVQLPATDRGGAGTSPADDPRVQAAVTDLVTALTATGVTADITTPLDVDGATTEPGQISVDGRSVMVGFELTGNDDAAEEHVQATLDAVDGVAAAHPDLLVEQFGNASADKALGETVGKDFQRAELLAVPLTLGILLAVFGAVIAALVPLALALTAFAASLGLLAFASRLFPTDEVASSVMLLIGLAVGVDYALFYIRREREERAKGTDPKRALEIAADTSGHTVLVSGLTVAISMAGLGLTGLDTFTGVGAGTVLVVLVAVLGSLTVLPALLSWLGDRIELLRIPLIGRRRVSAGHSKRRRGRAGRGGRRGSSDGGSADLVDTLGAAVLAERVAQAEQDARARDLRPGVMGRLLRHPVPVATVTGGLLVLLALPALGLRTAEPGLDDLPKDLPIMQTYKRVIAAFPGGPSPAVIVVSAPDVTTPDVSAAIDALTDRALATGQLFEPVTIDVSDDRQVARIFMPIAGSGTDQVSVDALHLLRDDVIPASLAGLDPTAVHADVTGMTAGSEDFNTQLAERTPVVIGFVLVLAFLLLLVAFRSAIVAGLAVGLNLLSVGAAYGLLVIVFQYHWADDLLGYTSTGQITNWLPLMLFVILFGLSMDYQVFVLSRVREAVRSGLSMHEAVLVGIRRSAWVVTSAAVIMVAVFSIFATLSQVSMKQLGVGLSAAILLDATVIRVVLMPALLALLGGKIERRWAVEGPAVDDTDTTAIGSGTDLGNAVDPDGPTDPWTPFPARNRPVPDVTARR